MTYQQQCALQAPQPPYKTTATIAEVENGRARLLFPDGSTSQKFYATNKNITFKPGQRVSIKHYSGTLIIEYPL